MSWKPSEGLKRSEPLTAEIHMAIMETGGVITPLGRHRMVEVIAKALDQALADGAEQDALASLGGNGHVAPLGSSLSEGITASLEQGGLITRAKAFGYDPATADPVGVDLPDFPAEPVIVDTHPGHGAVRYGAATAEIEMGDLVSLNTRDGTLTVTPIKKRGRPKGSANKAKPKRGRPKKDKAPVVAEAATIEPSAGEAAS